MSKNEEIAVLQETPLRWESDPLNPMCTFMQMQSPDFSAQVTWKKFT